MGNGPIIAWKDVISVTSTVVKETKNGGTIREKDNKRRRARSVSAILLTVESLHKQEEVLLLSNQIVSYEFHFFLGSNLIHGSF